MPGKWILISVLALGLGVLGAALSARKHPPPPVNTPSAAVITQKNEVTLNGSIRPQNVVTVGADIPGDIDVFLVDVGADVYQGQVLARVGTAGLESTRDAASGAVDKAQDVVSRGEATVNSARMEESRAEADALRARLALDRLQKVYERQRTLHNAGATPKLAFEKAQTDWEAAVKEFDIMDNALRAGRDNVQSALNQLSAAKKTLSDKTQEMDNAVADFQSAEVRSPADGTVVGRKGEVGKPAEEAGDQMFQIATDLYALEVPLDAKPEVLKRLRTGDPATVLILDLQSAGIPGEVKEVKDTQVIVQFNSALPAIRPGMRADVRLRLQ